jgi:hypothetical protein
VDDKVLQEYFFYDEADLNANRNGSLSEKQLKKLKDDDKGASKFVVIAMLVLFGIASIFPLIYKQITLPVIFWVAVWGGLGLYCLYCILYPAAIPVSKIVLKKAEGPIKFVAMDGSNHSEIEYDLRIGKVKLQVVSNDCTEIMKKAMCTRFTTMITRTAPAITPHRWNGWQTERREPV